MEKNRPTREDIFIRMAKLIAYRSTCDRRNVGVVVVNSDTNKILSVGYNGAPKGYKHCNEVGHFLINDKCVRTDHAELNALMCIENKYKNLILYTTDMPCLKCLSICIHFSIKTIFFINWYEDKVRDKLYFNENVGPVLIQYIPHEEINKKIYRGIIYSSTLKNVKIGGFLTREIKNQLGEINYEKIFNRYQHFK